MNAKIICGRTRNHMQDFYVVAGGKRYFLFSQPFRKSTAEYFRNGVYISDGISYENAHSHTVRKTLSKLPAYIHYVEKEYGVAVCNRTRQKDLPDNRKDLRHRRDSAREIRERLDEAA